MKLRTLRTILTICLVACLCSATCWAKKKKQADATPAPEATIVEVNPAEVTLAASPSDPGQTYRFVHATQITLDGNPATVQDLQAGMTATITVGTDNATLASLAAKDAPRVTKQPPKYTGGWWVRK